MESCEKNTFRRVCTILTLALGMHFSTSVVAQNDFEALAEVMRSQGWEVERDADGSILLFPPGGVDGTPLWQPPAIQPIPQTEVLPQTLTPPTNQSFEQLAQALEPKGWQVERGADGSLLLFPGVSPQTPGAATAVTERRVIATVPPDSLPALMEALAVHGWRVERAADGSVLLFPRPAQTQPFDAQQGVVMPPQSDQTLPTPPPPLATPSLVTDNGFARLQALFSPHGWRVERAPDGSILLFPGAGQLSAPAESTPPQYPVAQTPSPVPPGPGAPAYPPMSAPPPAETPVPVEFLPPPDEPEVPTVGRADQPQLSETEVAPDDTSLQPVEDVPDISSGGESAEAEDEDESTRLLMVSLVGQGSGTISSAPPGIDCDAACNYDYEAGTVVTLAAQPDAMSLFAGFSGDEDCADGEVVLNQPRECIATFDPLFALVSLVDKGDVELPVDAAGKAARIARDWLEKLDDERSTVGKIYDTEHAYVVSIVSEQPPHVLRDQLVIRRSDGRLMSVKSLPDLPDGEDIELPIDSTEAVQRLAERWIESQRIESQQLELQVAEIREIVKIYLVDVVSDKTPEKLNNQLLIRQRNGRVIPLL